MSKTSMPAIVVRETGNKGDWNRLVLDEVVRPSVHSGQVLVQVDACSVNRADLLQRRGLYPPPPGASPLLGLDFAGYIVGMAPDVEDWNLGASSGIDYRREDFEARIYEITRGEGVDVILDWIGAPYLNKHLNLLKPQGRLLMIGLMGGYKGEILLAPLVTKRLRIIGSILRNRSREEKTSLTQLFRKDVLPLLASGKVRPVVDRIYPIEAVEEAHCTMREGLHFGKIVLTWRGTSS